MVAGAQVALASVVMFVTGLERSVAFYSSVFAFQITVKTDSAALLVAPDGSQLYLRGIGERASHSLGTVGPQYVLWTAGSEADLAAAEASLRSQSSRVTVTDEGGFRMLEACDPDDIPVVVSFPGPNEFARDRIISRIYDW